MSDTGVQYHMISASGFLTNASGSSFEHSCDYGENHYQKLKQKTWKLSIYDFFNQ